MKIAEYTVYDNVFSKLHQTRTPQSEASPRKMKYCRGGCMCNERDQIFIFLKPLII